MPDQVRHGTVDYAAYVKVNYHLSSCRRQAAMGDSPTNALSSQQSTYPYTGLPHHFKAIIIYSFNSGIFKSIAGAVQQFLNKTRERLREGYYEIPFGCVINEV
jgi:hypothetical protein